MAYIAYFRVSTDKQGRSGLGLEAQQQSVSAFIGGTPDASYTEVESGGKKDRPELAKAIAQCKAEGATLIVAKLDRLARDVQMILSIVDSGIIVRFVDLPEINPNDPTGRLMLTMMAAFAEFERKLISKRTREAMAVAKITRGRKFGSANPSAGGIVTAAISKERARESAAGILPFINDLRAQGAVSLRAIAAGLTERRVQTPRGNHTWHPSQVANVLKFEAIPTP